MHLRTSVLASLTVGSATAVQPPDIKGMKIIWQESFAGCEGCAPDLAEWNVALDTHTNNEVQVYTISPSNLHLSGDQALRIIPRKAPSGEWTSSRIESKRSWTPGPGKAMRVQAALRTGSANRHDNAATKQGLWPAFWMLGDAVRHGAGWPLCGELDIFEQINGALTGYASVHCEKKVGGACNEPAGRSKAVAMPEDDEFHAWSVEIDRRSNNWKTEEIRWFMDGVPFHALTGAEIDDQALWPTVAHSPMFVLLNLAVGGDWPGNPGENTEDGYSSMMEVQYVAIYETK